MSATITRDAEGTVTGNTFDKYGSTQPGRPAPPGDVRARASASCSSRSTPRRCSTSGCGEGDPDAPVGDRAAADPRRRLRPRGPGDPGRVGAAAGAQPRVPDPAGAGAVPVRRGRVRARDGDRGARARARTRSTRVAEMARCARGGHLLVSVPREPLWRALNMARGAYVRELGNTPGHVNHWSRRGFAALLSRYGEVVEIALAVPLDDAARPRVAPPARRRGPNAPPRGRHARSRARAGPASYGRGARILSAGIATTGLVTFAYFSVASHVLERRRLRERSRCCGRCCSSPSRCSTGRSSSCSRARSPTAAPAGSSTTCRCGRRCCSRAASRSPSWSSRCCCARPIRDELLGGSAALYWILVVAVLAYAASYFARGWLAGHQWFALYGGLVFLESTSRLLFALAVAVGIAEGQTAVALGMAAAPLVLARRRPARVPPPRARAPSGAAAPAGRRSRPRPRRPVRARGAR